MQPPAEANWTPCDRPAPPDHARARRGRIALIGASVRAAAESARFGGFTVTGLDRFGDQDTLAACHGFGLLDGARPAGEEHLVSCRDEILRIAASMPLVPVGGLVLRPDTAIETLPLLGPWPGQREAVSRVRDLTFLREITSGSSIQLPPFLPADRGPSMRPRGGTRTRWLRKDPASSGGLGTRWMSGKEKAGPGEILQQWVRGRVFGATFLSNGADVLLLAICRSRFTRKGPLPFVYAGSIGPIDADPTVVRAMEAFGRLLLAATGLRGLFNVDFVVEPPGTLWLLEVNPRWSGSSELVERHLRRRRPELSLMALAIDGFDGLPLHNGLKEDALRRSEDPVFDKRIVFARREVRFDPAGLTRFLGPSVSLHDVPAAGRQIRRGEPVCTVIRKASRPESAETKEKDSMREHRALIDWLSGARRP